MSVHDEAVPGSTQDAAQLRYSKGVDVLAHCRENTAEDETVREKKTPTTVQQVCQDVR